MIERYEDSDSIDANFNDTGCDVIVTNYDNNI